MHRVNIRSGLRVLITNNTLAHRAGSELYAHDVALALLRRGHNPMIYSTVLGDVAKELRDASVPVIDDLGALNIGPDLIHGQHHLDAMTAMLRYPRVPALFFCHGWLPWYEMPPVFPSIVRYVAVDDLCCERLLTNAGVQMEKIRTLYNFVDLRRFEPRALLPEKPRSALIFSNYATENNFVKRIRSACQRAGIDRIDIVGLAAGNSVDRPERILLNYDIVFAKGRCALEAMATGCAVIVADFPGLGGMVSTQNMTRLRLLNFGIRTMQAALLTEDTVYSELTRYNAEDAAKVSAWIRQDACLERAMDKLEEYYAEALAERETVGNKPAEDFASAASNYLRSITSVIKSHEAQDQQATQDHVQALGRHRDLTFEAFPNFQSAVFMRDPVDMLAPTRPIQSGELLGYIDCAEVNSGSLRITGWACDGLNGRGCAAVLVVAGGQAIGRAIVNLSRPDVQRAMNLVTERAGFELVVDHIPQGIVQLLMLTVDGRMTKLADWAINDLVIEVKTESAD